MQLPDQGIPFSLRRSGQILLPLICSLSQALHAQPLLSEANDPKAPVERELRPQPSAQLQATLERMYQLLGKLKQEKLAPATRQAELEELMRDNQQILRSHNTWLDWQQPQTVESAALLLEKMIFEIAADEYAADEAAREQVLHNAPAELHLDPREPEVYEPPLLTPVTPQPAQVQVTEQKTIEPIEPAVTAPAANRIDNKEPQDRPEQKTINVGEQADVAVLADNRATVSMQDDNSVLRDVRNEKGELVLFGTVQLWLGGAVQVEAYAGEGLFTLAADGDSKSDTTIRRAEGILRASIGENSELRVQYDFDANIFRNLYWRWLSDSTSQSLTVGNQKEPVGLDYLVGSKFTTAMEPSAPSSTFASYRSTGIRYSRWAALDQEGRSFQWWGDSRTYMTGTIGVFGEDVEDSNDTDWAVTGRATVGGRKTEDSGYHLGISASYRHGEYDRIAPRPGLFDANRITLAQADADTKALIGFEGLAGKGALHGEFELYYADYSGGERDAEGWGGYGQLGWMFGGKRRDYQPRWGVWAPITAGKEHIFEIFGRVSLTHGNDNVDSSNELRLLTLGGNWYHRNFRVSANLLLADTKRDLSNEGSGHALGLRLQYLF